MATEPVFDAIIHAPLRLRLCGLLRHVDQAEFAVLREALAVSDASLSKHLRILIDVGYVSMAKNRSPGRSDARRLTWVRLTAPGRRAFDGHVAELQCIADGSADTTAPLEARRPA